MKSPLTSLGATKHTKYFCPGVHSPAALLFAFSTGHVQHVCTQDDYRLPCHLFLAEPCISPLANNGPWVLQSMRSWLLHSASWMSPSPAFYSRLLCCCLLPSCHFCSTLHTGLRAAGAAAKAKYKWTSGHCNAMQARQLTPRNGSALRSTILLAPFWCHPEWQLSLPCSASFVALKRA